MSDVFLSYARPDAAAAERVARALGKSGWSVWFDRELPAHRAYSDVIAAELETAGAVLVLWTKSSVGSQWVRSEANRARELGKLVESRLDDVRLPMPFDQIQCADLRGWRGSRAHAGWTQVRKSIEALLGGEPSQALPVDAGPSRRTILVGAGVVAAALAGGAFFRLNKPGVDHPSPEAALLLQKGIDILQNNDVFAADDPGSLRDAAALLTEATEADPGSPNAWGSLALAYAALKRVSAPRERPGLDARCRSAAAKALDLDPHEPRASGALLLLKPLYRNWLSAERDDSQALRSTHSPIPLLLFIMSEMLGSVGRCRDAAGTAARFDRKAFIIPGADEQVLIDLWSAGDLQGADQALKLAVQHWPQHPQVWATRLSYLMYSGRATEALELLGDDTARPPGTAGELVQVMSATARALAAQGSASDAVGANTSYLKANPSAVFQVAHACAALGDRMIPLSILQGYYFADGPWAQVAPAAGDEDRRTDALFQPPMRGVWNDPGFTQLLGRIGLEDYWRRSRTVPDFRRS